MSQNVTDIASITGLVVRSYIGISIYCVVTCQSVITIVVIWISPALRDTQYLVIVSVSLADVLQAVAGAAFCCMQISSVTSHLYNSYNIILCITFGAATSTVTTTGVHMAVISIDRYIRIAHPFYYVQKMTKQRMFKILICIWILGIVLASIPSIYDVMTIADNSYLVYYYTNLAIVQACLIIVCVFYFKIARLAINHKKATIARRHQSNRDPTVMRSYSVVMKSIKFFVTMFGVYFLCTVIPFIIFCIYNFIAKSDLLITIMYLYPVYSVINFFICCKMDKRFFRALRLTCKCF
jgi:hypothetical protein